MRKLVSILGVVAIGLVFSNASCGGNVRDQAGKVIIAAEAALHVATEAELALRCGQPTSVEGTCISPEKHEVFKVKLLKGFALLKDAKGIYDSLPPTGNPSIAEITNIISQIGTIIQEVIDGFPSLEGAKLASEPNVAKTLAVK